MALVLAVPMRLLPAAAKNFVAPKNTCKDFKASGAHAVAAYGGKKLS